MKFIHCIILCLSCAISTAQTKTGTSFYGNTNAKVELCPGRMDALSEKDVNKLITEMLARYGIKNRFIVLNCTEVANCQAAVLDGKPYILYNPNFLGSVKRLDFKNADLPVSDKDWATLTILAHELGHHVNFHLTNPLPDATQQDMELEADETAGFIIYLMGATLSQSQLAFNDVSIEGGYTHPGRQKRLDAIARGWEDAQKKYPGKQTISPSPPTGKSKAEIYASFIKEGENQQALENFEAAAEAFDKAIQTDPLKDEAYFKRGVLRYKDNSYAAAIPDFNKAINLGKNLDSYFYRGVCQRTLNNFNAAITDLNYFIKNKPIEFTLSTEMDPERKKMITLARLHRGICFLDYGDQKKACEDFSRANFDGSPEADGWCKKYCSFCLDPEK